MNICRKLNIWSFSMQFEVWSSVIFQAPSIEQLISHVLQISPSKTSIFGCPKLMPRTTFFEPLWIFQKWTKPLENLSSTLTWVYVSADMNRIVQNSFNCVNMGCPKLVPSDLNFGHSQACFPQDRIMSNFSHLIIRCISPGLHNWFNKFFWEMIFPKVIRQKHQNRCPKLGSVTVFF